MEIFSDELIGVADEFQKASGEIAIIVERLSASVKKLEDAWSDAGQQVFYQNYKEWETHRGGFSTMLQLIARNMHAIAERYMEADK